MRIFAAIRSTKLTFTNNLKYHYQASCKLAFHSGSKVYYPSSRASLDHLQLAHASSTTSSLSTTTSTMSTVLKVPKSNGLMGQAFKDWEDKVQAVNLPVRSMPILLDSSYWYYFEHPLLAAANLKQPDEQGYETEFAFLIWNCPGHPDNKKMPNHAHTAYN